MAVIGSGLGADCAPRDANYSRFFDSSSSPAWEVVLKVRVRSPLIRFTYIYQQYVIT
jgi:hypothetical protein